MTTSEHDPERLSPGGELSGQDAQRSSRGGEACGPDAERSSRGGEACGQDGQRSSRGGEACGSDAERCSPGGELSGPDGQRSSRGGEACGPDAERSSRGGELSERNQAVLGLERRSWAGPGAKERAMREQLGISPTRYYQLLNALLDDPRALAHDPVTVNRLRRLRDARRNRR